MTKLSVVGHKNPDTDSIVSALSAVEYFKKVHGIQAQAFRAGEPNNEAKFIFRKFGVEMPEIIKKAEGKVALVDHNETTQTFDGLDFDQVEYILDHHKMSVKTERPIFVRMEPIGSTSSLIGKLMISLGKDISEQTAKLLLAGILSDTLNFTSPTTTEKDKEIAAKLNEIAKINIESFVSEMFEAKSSLDGISIEEIITLDYKVFELGGKKIGVGTWETTGPESVNSKKVEIMEALKSEKEKNNLDFILFMVVDILKQVSYMYVVSESEKELAEKVFKVEAVDGLMELPGVVSRKKQVMPPLTQELEK